MKNYDEVVLSAFHLCMENYEETTHAQLVHQLFEEKLQQGAIDESLKMLADLLGHCEVYFKTVLVTLSSQHEVIGEIAKKYEYFKNKESIALAEIEMQLDKIKNKNFVDQSDAKLATYCYLIGKVIQNKDELVGHSSDPNVKYFAARVNVIADEVNKKFAPGFSIYRFQPMANGPWGEKHQKLSELRK